MLSVSQQPLFLPVETSSSVFSISIAKDNNTVVTGQSRGSIQLMSPKSGRLSHILYQSNEEYPTTSVRFLPNDPKHFLAASAQGLVSLFTLEPQPDKVWTLAETPNETYAMEVNNQGNRFAVGGLDRVIRVYDVQTQEIQRQLFKIKNDDESNGHINRIQALHYNKFNPHMLISAGIDDTIQFWDLRMNESIHQIIGPHVFSDSIDVYDHTFIAGSLRTQKQIQLFDLRTFQELAEIQWPTEKVNDRQCSIYACKFHPSGEYFFAAGHGDTNIKIFSTKTFQPIETMIHSSSTVYSIAFSPERDYFMYGNNEGIFTHSMRLN